MANGIFKDMNKCEEADMGRIWEIFWMGVICFIMLAFYHMFMGFRIDEQKQISWRSGYIAGYAEGKAGMTNREEQSPAKQDKSCCVGSR